MAMTITISIQIPPVASPPVVRSSVSISEESCCGVGSRAGFMVVDSKERRGKVNILGVMSD